MNEHSACIYTDLACESEATHDGGKAGTDYVEETVNGFRIARLTVENETGARMTGKRPGNYVTVFSERLYELEESAFGRLSALLADEIDALARASVGKTPGCVLVAGLGNREITADNIGPLTVDRLTVTRHIRAQDEKLFERFFRVPVCAIAPGVLGQTGIETAEVLAGICARAKPDLLIAIDALAARSTARLGATVQISDSGIFPGSGIGNRRMEISRETLNIPVLAIGIPTVVNSATLVYDALQSAGHGEPDDALRKVLREGESFFVSPRESDRISDCAATLLAGALDRLFLHKAVL